MNARYTNRHIPAGNPLANALIVIVGAIAIGASLILGVFAMIVIGCIVLVLAAIVGIRAWWMNSRFARHSRSATGKKKSHDPGVIEGEYRVITADEAGDRDSRE